MEELIPAICPYCGEAVEVMVDPGGGGRQRYVEDCPVCCRPWQVEVERGPDAEWSVLLHTSDE